jgi:protein associated with RNAse G/E
MNRDSFHAPAAVGAEITVNSRKYDGRVRRSWTGGLVSRSDEVIVLVGRFDQDVEHSDLGFISKGTVSFEYFWVSRWYNIFRFHEPDGELKAWYCNVAMPATLAGTVLDFVDLDIDVVVRPDMSYEVLDRDDFERNSIKYGYPDELRKTVSATEHEILALIRARSFPFDRTAPANFKFET